MRETHTKVCVCGRSSAGESGVKCRCVDAVRPTMGGFIKPWKVGGRTDRRLTGCGFDFRLPERLLYLFFPLSDPLKRPRRAPEAGKYLVRGGGSCGGLQKVALTAVRVQGSHFLLLRWLFWGYRGKTENKHSEV